MSYFQHKDERVYMFPETSTYLTPLDGTIVTANPVDYPWYSRLSIVPDGLDWDMPIRIKEKIWDIGSGKHPSHIINKMQDPIDITLNMLMVDARFLSMAIGTTVTADAGTSHVSTITFTVTKANMTHESYFLLYGITTAGIQKCYCVWFDVDTGGSSPAPTGTTAAECVVDGATTAADIATIAQGVITALDDFTATVDGAVVTVTQHGSTGFLGAVPDTRDGLTSSQCTFATTTNGSSTHTVTESVTSAAPSFGLHIEYDNGTEDIAVDLFGCTVISDEVNVDFAESVVKETVTIRASTYAIGLVSTVPPPKRTLPPLLWNQLAESASNYVIMLGTTDKTPKILSKMTLRVENEIDFHPEIGYTYVKNVIAGKRTVTMNLIGFIQLNDIWSTWYDTWDDALGYYTNAGARLNSEIKIERLATYDTWQLSIYNWLIETYNLRVFTIDDKVMGIDVTFTSATPDSNGYILDSFVITDYVPKIFYNEANS